MKPFTFSWPFKRGTFAVISAANLKQAKAEFRKLFPSYALYAGEVYWRN